jgi:hypothetical protein
VTIFMECPHSTLTKLALLLQSLDDVLGGPSYVPRMAGLFIGKGINKDQHLTDTQVRDARARGAVGRVESRKGARPGT